jgi:large-conductance mechanosensitive channel
MTSLIVPLLFFLSLKGYEMYTNSKSNPFINDMITESDIENFHIASQHKHTSTVFWFKFGIFEFISLSLVSFICFLIIWFIAKLLSQLR